MIADALSAFFVLGGVAFWVLCGIYGVVVLIAIHWDSGKWATIDTIAFLLILYFLAGFNPIPYLFEHPGRIALWCLTYVVIGIFWSIAKWWFFVHKRLRQFLEHKEKFFVSQITEDKASPELIERFQNNIRIFGEFPPRASTNKSRILVWMTWWWASMLWTMIDDPIRRFFNWLYSWLSGTFQAISDRAFAKHAKLLQRRLP